MPHTHPTLHLWVITAFIYPFNLMFRLSWHSPHLQYGTNRSHQVGFTCQLANEHLQKRSRDFGQINIYLLGTNIRLSIGLANFFQNIEMLKLFLTGFQLGVCSLVLKWKGITQRMQSKLYKLAARPEAVSWLTLFTSKDIRSSTYKEAEKSLFIQREQESLTWRQYLILLQWQVASELEVPRKFQLLTCGLCCREGMKKSPRSVPLKAGILSL